MHPRLIPQTIHFAIPRPAKLRTWPLAALLLLLFTSYSAQAQLALKSGIGGWALGHSMVEGELRISPRSTVALRLGAIHGKPSPYELEDIKQPLVAGIFAKAGPKFYLGEKAFEGFAIQPQAVFSYWHDWDEGTWGGNVGWRWEMATGALVQGSYTWRLWDRVLIEPQLALGWVRTFEREKGTNDQEPFGIWDSGWFAMYPDEIEAGRHSHLPIVRDLSISGGLQLGITLW